MINFGNIDKYFLELPETERKMFLKIIKVFSINPKVMYLFFLVLDAIFLNNVYLLNLIIFFVLDLFVFVLKRVIRRPRPMKYSSGTLSKLSGLGPDKYSFPSAHTFTAFQLIPFYFLIFINLNLPILVIPFVLYSFLVAASRIILKHHYFTDVLMGSIMGLSAGILNILLI